MLLYAHAKINLALSVTGRREDGYHLLDMVMQSVDLADELLILPGEGLTVRMDGKDAGEENLVTRAARLLGKAVQSPCAALELTKHIPARAGLGGGSADAAAALVGLRRFWRLEDRISDEELARLGLSLGADVPFCLRGGCARVRGIGDRVCPVPAPSWRCAVLVHPGEAYGISTPEAYRLFDSLCEPSGADCGRVLDGTPDWMDGMGNDLEKPACALCGRVEEMKSALSAFAPERVMMSGSGSAVFALFRDEAEAALCRDAMAKRYPFARLVTPCASGVTWGEA